MAVANDTILQKMAHELQKAKQNQHNQNEMLKNIANIRLLCDLFLSEEKPEPASERTEISAAELKAMIGQENSSNSNQTQTFKKSIELDDEDGNGDSIFDF